MKKGIYLFIFLLIVALHTFAQSDYINPGDRRRIEYLVGDI